MASGAIGLDYTSLIGPYPEPWFREGSGAGVVRSAYYGQRGTGTVRGHRSHRWIDDYL